MASDRPYADAGPAHATLPAPRPSPDPAEGGPGLAAAPRPARAVRARGVHWIGVPDRARPARAEDVAPEAGDPAGPPTRDDDELEDHLLGYLHGPRILERVR
jgi:hypothetical protein